MSSSIRFLGLLLIAHGGYSTKELNAQHKISSTSLPEDIIVEVCLGLIIVIVTTIVSSLQGLKPLYLADEHAEKAASGENPYEILESRPHFQDLISRRKKYLDWRRKTPKEN